MNMISRRSLFAAPALLLPGRALAGPSFDLGAALAALPPEGGTVDARHVVGTQALTSDPFAWASGPSTVLLGNSTWEWDTEAFSLLPPAGTQIIGHGTTFRPIAEGLGGNLSMGMISVFGDDVTLDGKLTFDGRQNELNPEFNLAGVWASEVNRLYVGPNVTFRNLDHGGAVLNACSECEVHGLYENIGRPADQLGSDIWIFRGTHDCLVETRAHRNGYVAVTVDDRTTKPDPLDGPCYQNVIRMGPTAVYDYGLIVSNASQCQFDCPHIVARREGFQFGGAQNAINPKTRNCTLRGGFIFGRERAFELTSESVLNVVSVLQVSGGPYVDAGTANRVLI